MPLVPCGSALVQCGFDTSEQFSVRMAEASHITDGDDFSWWIADDESQPQIVLLELE